MMFDFLLSLTMIFISSLWLDEITNQAIDTPTRVKEQLSVKMFPFVSGHIYSGSPLDREKTSSYTFFVLATDKGPVSQSSGTRVEVRNFGGKYLPEIRETF